LSSQGKKLSDPAPNVLVEREKSKAAYRLKKLSERLKPQAEGYWAALLKAKAADSESGVVLSKDGANPLHQADDTALVIADDIGGLLGRVPINEALAIVLAMADQVVDAFIEALDSDAERPN